MTSIHKIQTKHLNEHATLYGGQLLEWIDNYCFAKTEEYKKGAGDKFVTRAVNCEFLKPIFLGSVIELSLLKEEVGSTSLTFEYNVVVKGEVVAKGTSVFVKVCDGEKIPIDQECLGK